MDVIARLPDSDGQAADAVSANTQVRWRMLPDCSEFQSQNVQTFGYVYQNTNGPNHGSVWKTLVVPLERNLYAHPLAGLLWY